MGGNYLEEIKCPFYMFTPPGYRRKNNAKARHIIECEGIVNDMCVDLRFTNIDDYFKYKHYFCESLEKCVECPFYQLASLKYEEVIL